MPQRIIATGEFDNTEIVKGINGMIDALAKAQLQQEELQKENKLTTESLNDTGAGIKKLTDQIAALDKSNKDYAATNQILTGRLSALQQQYDKYNATIADQKKQIDQLNASIPKMTAAYEAAKKTVADLQATAGKPIAPSINDGKITNGLRAIRGHVTELGSNITKSMARGREAIEATSESLIELGMTFGPEAAIILAALIPVIKKVYEWATSLSEAEKQQKLLNSVFEDAGKIAASQVSKLEVLRSKINDVNTSLSERSRLVKEYNKEADKANQISDKEIGNLDLINEKMQTQIELIGQRAIATAAENSLNDEANKLIQAQQKFMTVTGTTSIEAAKNQAKGLQDAVADSEKSNQKLNQGSDALVNKTATSLRARNDKIQAANNEYLKQEKAFNDKLKLFGPLISVPGLTTDDKGGSTGTIQNIYQQELQKLKADIAKASENGFTDEATITRAIEEDFKKRDLAFQKAFKNKQLTAGQLASLEENLKNLQQLILDKSLKDFATQKAAYLQKISDQLNNLQNEESLKRIANIKDKFERERQTILAETEKTITALEERRRREIADLQKNAAKNGIDTATLQGQINNVDNAINELVQQVKIHSNQQLEQLSFEIFNKIGEDLANNLKRQNLDVSNVSLIDIQKQVALFQQGRISYEQFQKELTRIAKEENQARFEIEKQNLQDQITRLENRLVVDAVSDQNSKNKLTEDQIKQLEDKITQLKQQLANAETNNAKGQANPESDNSFTKGIQNLANYAAAVNSIAQEIGGFWKEVNDIEEQQLQRSIAIQNQRVTAAQQVAAKGNAEYLRMEEEKQQKLQLQQANNAKKQIAVNAALQASQLLVAITGAIASAVAATGPGAPFVIAGDIAAIVGALAAGYALVKSLSSNQPSFFVGTEDTGPGGRMDEKGGFSAVLHPHERVITAEDNKKLKGLSNREVIERVTENYRVKPALSLNTAAMEMATNQPHKMEAIRMEGIERELKLNNQLQLKTHRLLKSMGVNVNVDRHGLAVSVMESVEEISKSKKS